jgi:hypothetical protein
MVYESSLLRKLNESLQAKAKEEQRILNESVETQISEDVGLVAQIKANPQDYLLATNTHELLDSDEINGVTEIEDADGYTLDSLLEDGAIVFKLTDSPDASVISLSHEWRYHKYLKDEVAEVTDYLGEVTLDNTDPEYLKIIEKYDRLRESEPRKAIETLSELNDSEVGTFYFVELVGTLSVEEVKTVFNRTEEAESEEQDTIGPENLVDEAEDLSSQNHLWGFYGTIQPYSADPEDHEEYTKEEKDELFAKALNMIHDKSGIDKQTIKHFLDAKAGRWLADEVLNHNGNLQETIEVAYDKWIAKKLKDTDYSVSDKEFYGEAAEEVNEASPSVNEELSKDISYYISDLKSVNQQLTTFGWDYSNTEDPNDPVGKEFIKARALLDQAIDALGAAYEYAKDRESEIAE